MNTGDRIKEMRKLKGFTQEELAQKLGLKDSAIAKYESGRVENIKRNVIAEMAKVLDCSPVYLLCLDDDDSTSSSDNVSKGFILSDNEKELVLNYRRLNSEDKKMVERMIAYSAKIQSTNLTKNSN